MDEFSFIQAIKQPYYYQPTLIKGIGDDAAVFHQPFDEIVTAVDTFVDGIHFTRETVPLFFIGYRLLAANISDLAAMGAMPKFYLVSIVIPKTWDVEDLQEIMNGMSSLARKYKMDLIGGDTVSGTELSISITVIGYVKKGKSRYRSLAKPGDIVFATGTLGDAQAGLYILMNNGHFKNKDYFIKRHQKPTPRIEFGQYLSHIDRIALNDISDGIASEATEIANESLVNIVLNDEMIPTSIDFDQFPSKLQKKWKLYGGEDFELLGTVSAKDWPEVQKAANQAKVQVTKIGHVENCTNKGKVFLREKNCIKKITKQGYIHLK